MGLQKQKIQSSILIVLNLGSRLLILAIILNMTNTACGIYKLALVVGLELLRVDLRTVSPEIR